MRIFAKLEVFYFRDTPLVYFFLVDLLKVLLSLTVYKLIIAKL